MIGSRYDVFHSEAHVAAVMGLPYPPPNPDGYLVDSNRWASAEDELRYYRDPVKGLNKPGSEVFGSVYYLSDHLNYKKEIAAGRPSNLRRSSIGRNHHSRLLAGIRICLKNSNGRPYQQVRLGLLSPANKATLTDMPQDWAHFDPTINGQGDSATVGKFLKIGGLVVVRAKQAGAPLPKTFDPSKCKFHWYKIAHEASCKQWEKLKKSTDTGIMAPHGKE